MLFRDRAHNRGVELGPYPLEALATDPGLSQTEAAHDLCSALPAAKREHYVQPKVGHYGVFNGSRWRQHIQPRVRDFLRAHRAMMRGEPQVAAAE